MPRAEVGSTKHLANKMKSKGLQRLRWYCQVCERQMRDENGFKCHTQTEGHVRNMMLVGENSKKFITDYSNRFKSDFLQLLRTSHGEKMINLNRFYNEYIANKEHIHMNATRWNSLSEFGKFLGREGICRVQEGDKGLEVAWIDNSPEALRRQDAIRKRERQDKGDEEREQRQIAEQVRRARRQAEEKSNGSSGKDNTEGGDEGSDDGAARELRREEGDGKVVISFGAPKAKQGEGPAEAAAEKAQVPSPPRSGSDEDGGAPAEGAKEDGEAAAEQAKDPEAAIAAAAALPQPAKVGLKFGGGSTKPKNVFAVSKKNALGGSKPQKIVQKRPMSEAERIMREEMERKKIRMR